MKHVEYRLDLRNERLWRGAQPVRIGNKAFQLLRLFVTNPNRLLTKDHILKGVWGDVCVSPGSQYCGPGALVMGHILMGMGAARWPQSRRGHCRQLRPTGTSCAELSVANPSA